MMPYEEMNMAMPPSSSKHSDNVLPYAWQRAIVLPVFILSLGLYLLTLAPTIVTVFDDSLEFQLVTYLLGIAHPTGYPLYTLLGWLFTKLPLGDVAYRVNLMSAVFGAVTIALVYLIGLELIAGDWRPEAGHRTDTRQAWLEVLAALIGALALVISPVFWSQATIAEVYTLNAALMAGLLWLLVRGTYPPSERWLMALAFLLGVSLTHHRTALLMLPSMAYFLWPQFRTWRLRTWIKLTVALVMPCLLYLYIPLRGQVGSLDGTYTNTLEGFWRHVSTGGYGVFVFENPFGAERGVGFYFSLFLDQFGPLGFAAGLVGLLVLRRYRFQGLTAIIFATYLVFNLFYRVADIEVFFIPLFLIWTIWIAVAAGWLLTGQWAGKDHGSRLRLPVTLLTAFLLIGQSLVLLRSNMSELDRSNDWAVYDYGLDLMRQPLEPSAAIVGILGEVTLVRYFQETEGLRPDLLPIAADQEQERLTTVARLLDEGRPVYLTRELSGASARWSLGAIGPLILVVRQPILVPPNTSFPVGAAVTPGITLHGYDISRPSAHDGPSPVRLTVVWQATTPISRELKVSARLLDPEGQPVAQADAEPVHFAYPTTAWRAGEFISDVYDLYLPATLAPGEYTPIIIVYDPAQGAAEIGRVMLSPVYLP
jgi:hypothetical protein